MTNSLKRLLPAGISVGLVALAAGPVVVRQSTVASSVYEMAYLKWCPGHQPGSPRQIRIKLPSIDIYDARGALVYHGEGADGNAAVVNSLPRQIRALRPSGTHPNLKDALEMTPNFANVRSSILSGGRYTVLALSSSSQCSKCPLQNEAVANLKKRASQSNLNVLELFLD